jgi:NCAIR mutase (PurE)-related protein
MNLERIRDLLRRVQEGELSAEDAFRALKWTPYEDLGYARVDTHRRLRTGFPEVVYCESKSIEQVCGIVERLLAHNDFVLATRVSSQQAEALQRQHPDAVHHQPARIVEVRSAARPQPAEGARSVMIIAAGTSDLPVAEEAAVTAECLGCRADRLYDVGVAGLHRLLDARDRIDAAGVIIVVAGMEGALASVVGGLVQQPVIAVPTSVGYGAAFQGLAALLAMLNSCAPGVAVVNIDNGFGAGYFASLINQSPGST